MTILDRYISKEFVKSFLLVIASFISIYLIVDFFGRIRMFLSNSASPYQIASYFFFTIPMITSLTIPAAVLLASLITFGSLSKHAEITALKANGVSLYRTSLPPIVISVVISILAFLISEFVSPYTNRKADYIRYVEVEKRELPGFLKQNEIWYRGKKGIYNFKIFEQETNTLKGITIHYLNHDFELTMRADAARAVWKNDKWIFYNALITKFPRGKPPHLEWLKEGVIDLPERPSDFNSFQEDAEKMGYFELRKYIRKLRSEGYDATRYIVDMHGKIAFTFISIILALIGISFSLKSERSGGVAQSIGAGIVLGFSFWIVYAFTINIGRSGTIPPLLSAWLADIIFGFAAVIMIVRVKT
ncbi:MAG: LPS export ABC transporter permease LptG [Syntrophales bacterium]|nr:LPS export ABC transporter permease LptG [Syntrophales bacterium]